MLRIRPATVAAAVLWLVAVAATGVTAFRRLYGFDAAQWTLWRDLFNEFMSGAALPLDFVIIALGLCLAAIAGVVMLVLWLPPFKGKPRPRRDCRVRHSLEPPAPPEPPGDADAVAFARAMAVFEVWVEPPPAWMVETLKDELARMSAAGWTKMSGWGDAAARLLRHAERLGFSATGCRSQSAGQSAAPP